MENTMSCDTSYEWTVEEIQERLGASTVMFPRDRLLQVKDIARMREIGLRNIEIIPHAPMMEFKPGHLDFDNRAHIEEIMTECQRLGVVVAAMHSPNFMYDSEDESIRKAAVAEAVFVAKVAAEMGAGIFACHSSLTEHGQKSVDEMLDELEGYSIKIGIENLDKNLTDYAVFVDKVGSDRVGMIVDIGHRIDDDGVNPFTEKSRARESMVVCGERLIHLHLHDMDPLMPAVDGDHVTPMDGSIEWGEVFAALKDIDYQGLFMFESVFPPGTRERVSGYIDGIRVESDEYVLRKVGAFAESFVEKYVKRNCPN